MGRKEIFEMRSKNGRWCVIDIISNGANAIMRLSGEFDRYFLASIFQLISDEGLSGILHLSSGARRARVFIHEGQVVNTPGGENRQRLGQWLIGAGVLSESQLPALIDAARAAGCGLGTLLIDREMLGPDELRECLSRQTQEVIWDTFSWQDGTFRFDPCDIDVGCKTRVALDVQALILDALRRYDESGGPIDDEGGDDDGDRPVVSAEQVAGVIEWQGAPADAPTAVGRRRSPVRVLVVDDSRLLRNAVTAFLEGCRGITVVGRAADGAAAVGLASALAPDVIIMDVHMPVMDGLSALKRIMLANPTPVIVLSSHTREGAWETFEALRLGAVDVVAKPARTQSSALSDAFAAIEEKVRRASRITGATLTLLRAHTRVGAVPALQCLRPGDRVAAGATAEGGYRSLMKILASLAFQMPTAMVVATSNAPGPLGGFAKYLARFSDVPVLRPRHREPVQANACYLIAGTERVTISRHEDFFCFNVSPARQAPGPQAIPLMASVANTLGPDGVALALAGNAYDGLQGIMAIRAAGGQAVALNPAGCIDHGVAAEAIASHCVDAVMTEAEIGQWLATHAPVPTRIEDLACAV